ncbi:Lsr2 family protein [Mycolicibacterium sp. S2-37]|uniref:histone-like nucleoid-structuring protein Lsr2 n=1 Tax=Mycolicibacterium sp. S2-37 TaxID=2810297 RepID=UPI001A94F595|nr:Lsr2 family protein [Mycolicibacterium sp. S2-37]MBO0676730.1 Lsr2 family protein [Mycolicibacterium sp. S2-37]
MARKEIITDDLDETEGATTHSFSIDGAEYAIDLVDANWEKFLSDIKPFVDVARQIGGRRTARVRASGANNTEIRQWARARGKNVSDRGQIPTDIIAEFEAAHANGNGAAAGRANSVKKTPAKKSAAKKAPAKKAAAKKSSTSATAQ